MPAICDKKLCQVVLILAQVSTRIRTTTATGATRLGCTQYACGATRSAAGHLNNLRHSQRWLDAEGIDAELALTVSIRTLKARVKGQSRLLRLAKQSPKPLQLPSARPARIQRKRHQRKRHEEIENQVSKC